MVLIVIGASFGAVAYAATAPRSAGERAQTTSASAAKPGPWTVAAARRKRRIKPPPKPHITKHPETVSTTTNADFSFVVKRKVRGLKFECQLDGKKWARCSDPARYKGLAAGAHSFSVRAVHARKRSRATSFRWSLFEPKSFSIEPRVTGIPALFPGAGAVQLPVRIVNPNPVPIFVTSLGVSVSADPSPGCEGSVNFEALPSNASTAAPVQVPANSSVDLPSAAASAPAIALRELPFNQNACQGAQVPLAFSGEAHG